MKISVSLFLLFFMVKTSFSQKEAYIVKKNVEEDRLETETVIYDPETEVKNDEAYVFIRTESTYVSIIYVVGDQTTRYQKVVAAFAAVNLVKQIYNAYLLENFPIYFRRETSGSVNKFADVLEERAIVFENIPRLYKVGADFIIQIPLNPELIDNKNAFVLHDGSAVTVHSPSSDSRIKTLTDRFCNLILHFEAKKYDINAPMVSDKFDADYKNFIDKIKEIVKFLPEHDLKNTKTINEEFNAEVSLTPDQDRLFEVIKRVMSKRILIYMSRTATKSADYDKISSSGTASTSTSFAMEDEAVKREGEAQSSLVMSEIPHVLTYSEALTFINQRPIIIFGPSDCLLKGGEFGPHEQFIFSCVYIVRDSTNNELIVYFGHLGDENDYLAAVTIAEEYLHNNPSMKITYICNDYYILPPHFQVHFKSTVKQLLTGYIRRL